MIRYPFVSNKRKQFWTTPTRDYFEIWVFQNSVESFLRHFVDPDESFPSSLPFQKSASMQHGTVGLTCGFGFPRASSFFSPLLIDAARALLRYPKPRRAANKRFEISKFKFKFKFPRARTYELFRARSRLYRSQILQVNNRWKALAEIYTVHSFAPLSNFNFPLKIAEVFAVFLQNVANFARLLLNLLNFAKC